MRPEDTASIAARMRREWDDRARANAYHFVASEREIWSLDEFLESGRGSVQKLVVEDLERITGGRDPKQLRMLEIGCGAGRMTAALSEVFGHVHALDVSPEMLDRARQVIERRTNVTLHLGDGASLDALGDLRIDFVFSYIVFQHIPDSRVIADYVRDGARRLRPGGVYKFQVQGARDAPNEPADTWRGARLGPQEVVNLARETACELADFEGLGEQYFWLWFRKGAEAPAPDRSVDLLLAEAARLTAKIEGLAETVAERTAWALTLDRRINELGAVVSRLRDELERSNKWAGSLDQEVQSLRDSVERGQAEIERRTRWAQERDAHAAQLGAAVSDLQSELEERTRWARGLEADVEERTRWARGLEQELNGARSALARIQASLGYRIAARLGLIPRPEPD